MIEDGGCGLVGEGRPDVAGGVGRALSELNDGCGEPGSRSVPLGASPASLEGGAVEGPASSVEVDAAVAAADSVAAFAAASSSCFFFASASSASPASASASADIQSSYYYSAALPSHVPPPPTQPPHRDAVELHQPQPQRAPAQHQYLQTTEVLAGHPAHHTPHPVWRVEDYRGRLVQ